MDELGSSWMCQVCQLFRWITPMLMVTLEESLFPHFRDSKIEAWGREIQYSEGLLCCPIPSIIYTIRPVRSTVQSRAEAPSQPQAPFLMCQRIGSKKNTSSTCVIV